MTVHIPDPDVQQMQTPEGRAATGGYRRVRGRGEGDRIEGVRKVVTGRNLTLRGEHTMALMVSILISQMKELGVIFYNCSCLVLDLQRIFALYSSLKFKSRVPQTWSKRLYGVYDTEKKLQLQLNETKSQAFVSVSCGPVAPPPPLSLPGPLIKLEYSRAISCRAKTSSTDGSVLPRSPKSSSLPTLRLSRSLSLVMTGIPVERPS